MGYAVADAAARRGAAVTLVTTTRRPCDDAVETVQVETAEEMHDAVLARFPECDIVVMAAAVADFRPKAIAPEKLKKRDGVPEIVLEPTPDILGTLGGAQGTSTSWASRPRRRSSGCTQPRSSPPSGSI